MGQGFAVQVWRPMLESPEPTKPGVAAGGRRQKDPQRPRPPGKSSGSSQLEGQ